MYLIRIPHIHTNPIQWTVFDEQSTLYPIILSTLIGLGIIILIRVVWGIFFSNPSPATDTQAIDMDAIKQTFAWIREQDEANAKDAEKYRLIGNAAKALAAAAEANGVPVHTLLPMVEYLTGRIRGAHRKRL